MGLLVRYGDGAVLDEGSGDPATAIDYRRTALGRSVTGFITRGWFVTNSPMNEMEIDALLRHLLRRRSPSCWDERACRNVQALIEDRMDAEQWENERFVSQRLAVMLRGREYAVWHVAVQRWIHEPLREFMESVRTASGGKIPASRVAALRAVFVGCLYEAAAGTVLPEVRPRLRVVRSADHPPSVTEPRRR